MRTWCSMLVAMLFGCSAPAWADSATPEGGTEASPGVVEAAPAPPNATTTPSTPTVIKADLYLENIGKVDFAAGVYEAELIVAIQTENLAAFEPKFELLNGTLKTEKGEARIDEQESSDEQERLFQFKAEVSFDPDFRRFPLDEQDLSIVLTLANASTKTVTFAGLGEADDSRLGEKARIAGWELDEGAPVVGEDVTVAGAARTPTLTLPVSMVRTRFPSLLKTFFPLTIMLLISMLGLGMGISVIGPRISLMTGTLLGAAMFHINALNALPPVGYLTLADKIFIATYFSVLLNAVFSIQMSRAKEANQDALVKRRSQLALRVVPACTALLLLLAVVTS